MRVIGLDKASLAYFRSSSLMPSGSEARPLFMALNALLTSAYFFGDCGYLGSPVKGSSGSLSWSVNCSLNHSCIASTFPWYAAILPPACYLQIPCQGFVYMNNNNIFFILYKKVQQRHKNNYSYKYVS